MLGCSLEPRRRRCCAPQRKKKKTIQAIIVCPNVGQQNRAAAVDEQAELLVVIELVEPTADGLHCDTSNTITVDPFFFHIIQSQEALSRSAPDARLSLTSALQSVIAPRVRTKMPVVLLPNQPGLPLWCSAQLPRQRIWVLQVHAVPPVAIRSIQIGQRDGALGKDIQPSLLLPLNSLNG